MSKKTKNTLNSDFDLDSGIDDFDFDFPDPNVKDDRKPTVKILSGALEGAKDQVKSASFIKQAIKNVLPSGFGESIDMADRVNETVKSLYDESMADIKPTIRQAKSTITKLIPSDAKGLPKVISDKLKEWKTELASENSNIVKAAEGREAVLSSTLQDIFQTTALADQAKYAEAQGRDKLQQGVDLIRHRSLLDGINRSAIALTRLDNYQTKITLNYQKKSLELKYRHLFATQDLLTYAKEDSVKRDNILLAISKNTALPEFVKIKQSEARKQVYANKLFEATYNGLFGSRDKMIENMIKKFSSNAMAKVKEVGGGIRDGLSQLDMAHEMTTSMGGDPLVMTGNMVGSSAAEGLGNKIGKMLRGKLAKTKVGGKLQHAGNWLNNGLENLPNHLNEFKKTSKYAWGGGIFNGIMSFIQDALPGTGIDKGLATFKGKDMDSPFHFTRRTDRSINDIIPGYLARIFRELQVTRTKNTKIPLLQFSHDKGTFTTSTALEKEIISKVAPKDAVRRTDNNLERILKEIDPEGKKLSKEGRAVLKKRLLHNSANRNLASKDRLANAASYRGEKKENVDEVTKVMSEYLDSLSVTQKTNFDNMHNTLASDIADPRQLMQEQIDLGNAGHLKRNGLLNAEGDQVNSDAFLAHYLDPKNVAASKVEDKQPTAHGEAQFASSPLSDAIDKGADKAMAKAQQAYAFASEKYAKAKAAAKGSSAGQAAQAAYDQHAPGVKAGYQKAKGKLSEHVDTAKDLAEKKWAEAEAFAKKHVTKKSIKTNAKMAARAAKKGMKSAAEAVMDTEIGQNAHGLYAKAKPVVGQKLSDAKNKATEVGKKLKEGASLGKIFELAKDADSDVYVKGENSPRIRGVYLVQGFYKDKVTDKVITSAKDITGAVIDLTGKLIIKKDEISKLVVYSSSKKMFEELSELGGKTKDSLIKKVKRKPVKGFAEGGSPKKNELSIVGENGPEVFVPHTAGQIVPYTPINLQDSYDELYGKMSGEKIKKTRKKKNKKKDDLKWKAPTEDVEDIVSIDRNKKETKDIYVKGEKEPRIVGVLMDNGYYFDKASGKAIYDIKDIKGDVINNFGTIFILQEEIPDLQYYNFDTKKYENVSELGLSYKPSVTKLVDSVKANVNSMKAEAVASFKAAFTEKTEDVDIYVKGEKDPRLTAAGMKAGNYLDVNSNKIIHSKKDITGPVKDIKLDKVVLQLEELTQLSFWDANIRKWSPLDISKRVLSAAWHYQTQIAPKWAAWNLRMVAKASTALAGFTLRVGGAILGIKSNKPRDVYVKGDPTKLPRLTGIGFTNGEYFDAATGNVLKNESEISGPVKGKDGIILEDHELDRLYTLDSIIGKYNPIKLLGKALKAIAVGAWNFTTKVAAPMAWRGLKAVGRGAAAVGGAIGKGLLRVAGLRMGPQDVHVNGQSLAVLSGKKMRAGAYTSALTNAVIRSPNDIDGPVMEDGQLVIDAKDIEAGLTTAPTDMSPGVQIKLKKPSGMTISKVFGAIGSFLNPKSKTKLNVVRKPTPLTEPEAAAVKSATTLDQLLITVTDIANKEAKPRNGSYEDEQNAEKAAKDKDTKAIENKDSKDSKKKGSAVGLLGALAGKKEEEKEGGGQTLTDMAEQAVMDKAVDKVTGKVGGKAAGTVAEGAGKAASKWGGKALLKGGGKMLGLAGAAYGAYSAYDNFKQGNYGEAALDAGLSAGTAAVSLGGTGALISGATALGGGIASAAGGLLSIVGAPVLLGAAALGLLAYGGYKLYKHIERGNLSSLDNLRMVQYGFMPEDTGNIKKVIDLESYLSDKIIVTPYGIDYDTKKFDADKIMATFDMDSKDPKQVELFGRWMQGRFKPVSLSHLAAIKGITGKADLSEISGLKKDQKKPYLDGVKSLSINTSVLVPIPPSSDPVQTSGDSEIAKAVQTAQDEIEGKDTKKEEGKSSKSALEKSASILGVSADKMGKPAEKLGIGGQILSTLSSIGAAAISGISAIGKGLLDFISSPFIYAGPIGLLAYGGYKLYKYFNRGALPALDNLRIIQYGFMPEDTGNIKKVIDLESYLSDKIIDSGSGADFDYKKLDTSKMLGIFNLNSEDQKQVDVFANWFQNRFKPICLAHLAAIKSISGAPDLSKIADLKAEQKQQYLDAVKILSVKADIIIPILGADTKTAGNKEVQDAITAASNEIDSTKKDTVKKPTSVADKVTDTIFGKAAAAEIDQSKVPKAAPATPPANLAAAVTPTASPSIAAIAATPSGATITTGSGLPLITDNSGPVKQGAANSSSSSTTASDDLGKLSAKYESSTDGPSAVGWDSTGGTSYGTYQIATKTGTMDKFLSFLKDARPDWYALLMAAGKPDGGKNGPFAQVWKDIARQNPKEFNDLQHKFIKETHYDLAANKLSGAGLDINTKSKTMQDVLWSTAVQHGPGAAPGIFKKAIKEAGGPASDEASIIKAVYAERATRFGSSSMNVQASVANRYKQEQAQALASLSGDGGVSSREITSPVANPTSAAVTTSLPKVEIPPAKDVDRQSRTGANLPRGALAAQIAQQGDKENAALDASHGISPTPLMSTPEYLPTPNNQNTTNPNASGPGMGNAYGFSTAQSAVATMPQTGGGIDKTLMAGTESLLSQQLSVQMKIFELLEKRFNSSEQAAAPAKESAEPDKQPSQYNYNPPKVPISMRRVMA